MAQLTQRRYSNIANNQSAEDYLVTLPNSTTTTGISGTLFGSVKQPGSVDVAWIGAGINATQQSFIDNVGINLVSTSDFPGYTSNQILDFYTSGVVGHISDLSSQYFYDKLYMPDQRGVSTNTVTGSGREFDYVDYLLTQIGRQADLAFSSPGSPNYKAAQAGQAAVSEFYRLDGGYGSLAVTGGGYNASTSGTAFAKKDAFTGGVIPKDWNKDTMGNPLPWGARRESDGNVYYTSSGASPALPKPTVYNIPTSNLTVAYVPSWTPSSVKTYTSPTYSIGAPVSYTSKVYHIR